MKSLVRIISLTVLFFLSAAAYAQSSGPSAPPPPICSSSTPGAIYTETGTTPPTVYTCSYYNLVWRWVVNPSYGGLVYYPTVPATCSGALPAFLAGWPNTQMYVCVSGTPTKIGGYGYTIPIAAGGTGASTAAGANLNINGVTQTGTLGTSSQVSTFPGTVAATALTATGNLNANQVLSAGLVEGGSFYTTGTANLGPTVVTGNESVTGALNGTSASFSGQVSSPTVTATSYNSAPISWFGTGNANIGGSLPSTSTGSNNSAQGVYALQFNTTGSSNSAQGYQALYSNTTGSSNSAQGTGALYLNTTGFYNSAQGAGALYSNITGNNNTSSGYQAGRYISGGSSPNQTSSNSLYDGANTEPLADGDTNENVIGNGTVGHGSNTTTLGNSSTIGTWKFGTQHVIATAPTTSAGTVATYSTNAGGEITGLSAATSVTITFANSGWTSAAFCTATPSTTLATVVYNSAQSKTAVTFTFPALTGGLFYHCDGN